MIKIEIERLVRIFDAKPFLRNCQGKDCTNPATCLSVYARSIYAPMWWCDYCDPYQMGARDGKLYLIRMYQDAILHHRTYGTSKKILKDLVKRIAMEKGLAKMVGQKQAEEFFGRI